MTLRHTTGLPTWELYQDRLVHAVVRAQRSNQVLAVALLAVDFVADGWQPREAPPGGHERVAERLDDIVRASDTVAAAPNDLFALLLEDVGGPTGASIGVKRILHELTYVDVGAATHRLRTRIGIGLSAPPHQPVSQTLLQAEVALVQAMRSEETTFSLFDALRDGDLLQELLAESPAAEGRDAS